jgi:hypothetical protein
VALSANLSQAVDLLDGITNEASPTLYGRPDISALVDVMRLLVDEIAALTVGAVTVSPVSIVDNDDGTATVAIA